MTAEYLGPGEPLYIWPRWRWRFSNGWVFLFGLRDHQREAYAAGWRMWAKRRGW